MGPISPRSDLSDADVREADLSNADLSGADLTGANLLGADVREALLEGLVGRSAHHYGATEPG